MVASGAAKTNLPSRTSTVRPLGERCLLRSSGKAITIPPLPVFMLSPQCDALNRARWRINPVLVLGVAISQRELSASRRDAPGAHNPALLAEAPASLQAFS